MEDKECTYENKKKAQATCLKNEAIHIFVSVPACAVCQVTQFQHNPSQLQVWKYFFLATLPCLHPMNRLL